MVYLFSDTTKSKVYITTQLPAEGEQAKMYKTLITYVPILPCLILSKVVIQLTMQTSSSSPCVSKGDINLLLQQHNSICRS